MTNTQQDQPAKPIVVGVDGSETSVLALKEGARLASALGLPLLAISAWRYPAFFGKFPGADWSPEHDSKAILESSAAEAFADAPSAVEFVAEARHGAAAAVLIAASADAHFLIVGNRGRGGFAGRLLGSVSSTVAEYASCPVLIIRDEKSVARPSTEPEWTP